MNINEQLEPLKEAYTDIKIPEGLEMAISKGIEQGKKEYKMGKMKTPWVKGIAYAAAVGILFTASINLSPAFADQLKTLPVIGEIVKVLQFTDGKASGGQRTDGTDVSLVDLNAQGEKENLTIHFEQGGASQSLAGAYELHYNEKPYTMTFAISGARMMSAAEDFEQLKASRYVKSVYPIITLDDSMVRFMVEFKGPIQYEVTEVKEPASLVLQIREGQESESSKSMGYAIVSEQMPQGEGMAMLEEIFRMDFDGMRVLPVKENAELYYMEMGQFETESDALQKMESINTLLQDQGLTLKIVERKEQ